MPRQKTLRNPRRLKKTALLRLAIPTELKKALEDEASRAHAPSMSAWIRSTLARSVGRLDLADD